LGFDGRLDVLVVDGSGGLQVDDVGDLVAHLVVSGGDELRSASTDLADLDTV
jgi:hypothetical protein